jgi:low affinity Fe/Cu permease
MASRGEASRRRIRMTTSRKQARSAKTASAAAVRSARGNGQAPATKSFVQSFNEWFGWLAHQMAHLSGKAATFVVAVALILIWAATGPLFHFSDTWQLIINTSTTIITFLMVFLIQNTQNRDTAALQIKLSELIIAAQGAKNKLATAEDLTEEELEQLHAEYQRRASDALQQLERRRSGRRPH